MGNDNSTKPKVEPIEETTNKPLNLTQLQFLQGHTDAVRLLLRIDNSKFASASHDGLVLIWNKQPGQLIEVLEGHSDAVLCMIMINDNIMITGSLDKTIRIWDIRNGSCLHLLYAHKGPVQVIIKGINNGFISGGAGGLVILWNSDFTLNRVIDLNESNLQRVQRLKSKLSTDTNDLPPLNISSKPKLKIGTKSDSSIKYKSNNNKSNKKSNNPYSKYNLNDDDNIKSHLNSSSSESPSPVLSSNSTSPQRLSKSNLKVKSNNKKKRSQSKSPPQNTVKTLLPLTPNVLNILSDTKSASFNDKLNKYDIEHLLLLQDKTQLICGCNDGVLVFINLSHNDRCIPVRKHESNLSKILQLNNMSLTNTNSDKDNRDRLISISMDGLICFWRIDPYRPQCLQRINDRTNESLFDPNLKNNINSNIKKLDIHCILKLKNGDFIAGVGCGFVIFDKLFSIRLAIRNAHNATIIDLCTIKNDGLLVTASLDKSIKLWNLSYLNHDLTTKNPIRLHSLYYLFYSNSFNINNNNNNNKKFKKNNKKFKNIYRINNNYNNRFKINNNNNKLNNKNNKLNNNFIFDNGYETESNVTKYSIESSKLLAATFRIHSYPISCLLSLDEHSFVSCDHHHQVILWKDASVVSEYQNHSIRSYFKIQ